MTARVLGTAFVVWPFACALLYGLRAAWRRYRARRVARAAERAARPHSVHAATAAQDAAAILHAALTECPGCAAEERTRDVLQLSVLELYPPDHTCPQPARSSEAGA
ncbi:hypothetical protein [Streptomyces sp. NPDC096153]|uniref:hypothetical protein n=1 Tax=Streptomyces sp. NPDC096153 TaxID=3155548 RepID=UPI00331B35F2